MASLLTQFKKNGFVLVPGVLDRSEALAMRELIHDLWKKYANDNDKRMLLPKEVLAHRELYLLPFRKKIVSALKEVFGSEYTLFCDFQVQKDMFGYPGWHEDCGSEVPSSYLFEPAYRFAKCGVYLQDNSEEWGGGIDIVPGGHHFPIRTGKNKFDYRIKHAVTLLRIRFQRYMVPTKMGDFVFFDSRLPHTSTWPQKLTKPEVVHDAIKNMPAGHEKLVVYWNVTSTQRYADLFLENSVRRAKEEQSKKQRELFFSDYLGKVFPNHFQPDFIESAQNEGISIASLKPQDAEYWRNCPL